MQSFLKMNRGQLECEITELKSRYEDIKSQNLSLDMTRGKPCREQLDMGSELLHILKTDDVFSEDGTDCRNYGLPNGIPEARQFFARMLDTHPDKISVGNNSSLNLMFDTLMRSLVFGEIESEEPWSKVENRKWLCPVPGYDRHFLVTQTLGFELIAVPLSEYGPDMILKDILLTSNICRMRWPVRFTMNRPVWGMSQKYANGLKSEENSFLNSLMSILLVRISRGVTFVTSRFL